MYAQTLTKLPLATWARLMGVHPLHFAQVSFTPANAKFPSGNCDSVMAQHEWQEADATSREEVARAIAQAEENIERELGFRLLPSWEVDEWRETMRYFRPELDNLSLTDLRGAAQALKARWGHLVTVGQRATSLLAAGSAITWSDVVAVGDGYDETGTVTVAGLAAAVVACEVHIYYPGHAGDPAFEIRPIDVSITAGVATITFRRELAVLEDLLEAFKPLAAEGADDANFLDEVDVYRVYNDPSAPATLLWENRPTTCGCADDSCPSCDYSAQTACLNFRGDPANGWLSYEPATYDSDTDAWARQDPSVGRNPDIVRLWYQAGLRDKRVACPSRDMETQWALAVARYAASILDRPPCACARETWERWRVDLAFRGGAEELATYELTPSDLGSPFGTAAGAIYAWRRVKAAESGAAARFAIAP